MCRVNCGREFNGESKGDLGKLKSVVEICVFERVLGRVDEGVLVSQRRFEGKHGSISGFGP